MADNQADASPYLASDPSAISLSYLARISEAVYESNDNGRPPQGIIEVGPDRFSIHEHRHPETNTRTLFVAICGTSSPLQHVMNVMPHAFSGLHFVEQALSEKNTNNNSNGSQDRSAPTTTHRDAYEAGHVQGWKDPAKNIYEEVLRVSSAPRNEHDEETTAITTSDDAAATPSPPLDVNEKYDRIVFTGHSRGGLLAYHAGVCCAKGTESQSPFRGALVVVGFGMPPPLSPPSDPLEHAVCARSLLSVFHTHDPVANGSILKLPAAPYWNPLQLSVGLTREEQAEKARKQNEQRALRSASSIRGGSGFWGAVGNLVQTAVTAVGDTASEVTSNIDQYHSIGEYLRKIVGGHGNLLPKDAAAAAPLAIAANATTSEAVAEPLASFGVEKRSKENQWAVVVRASPRDATN